MDPEHKFTDTTEYLMAQYNKTHADPTSSEHAKAKHNLATTLSKIANENAVKKLDLNSKTTAIFQAKCSWLSRWIEEVAKS